MDYFRDFLGIYRALYLTGGKPSDRRTLEMLIIDKRTDDCVLPRAAALVSYLKKSVWGHDGVVSNNMHAHRLGA